VAKCPLFGSNFVLKDASLNFASVRFPEERGGRFSEVSFTFMLKSIGAFVCVRSREVVRFWEGPLREAPLYLIQNQIIASLVTRYKDECIVGYQTRVSET